MRNLTLTLAALLLFGGSAFAGSYRVHYNVAVAERSPLRLNPPLKLDAWRALG